MSDFYLQTLNAMGVKQLKKQLSKNGLPYSGKKSDLVQRLFDQFEQINKKDQAVGVAQTSAMDAKLRRSDEAQQSMADFKHATSVVDVKPSPSATVDVKPDSFVKAKGSKESSSARLKSKKTSMRSGKSASQSGSTGETSKAERKVRLLQQLKELELSSDDDSMSEDEDVSDGEGTDPDDDSDPGYRDVKKKKAPRRYVYDERLVFEKLPAPTPPVFDGNVLDYSDWKVAFDGLIDHLPLRASQKFYYLKQYLEGKALSAVSSYFMTNTDRAYKDARKLLDKRFGDKFLLCREIHAQLRDWPKVGNRDSEALRDFSDFLAKCLTMKEQISSLGRLDDITEIQELTRKLPDWCANKWNDRAYNYREKYDDYPNFERFVKFLRKEADKACDSVYSMGALKKLDQPTVTRPVVTAPNRSKTDKAMTRQTSANLVNETKPKPRKPIIADSVKEEDAQTCHYCDGTFHNMISCTRFAQLSVQDRVKFVADNRVCFGCLDGKHFSKTCRNRATCDKCKKKHPTLLHRDEKKPTDEAPKPTNAVGEKTASSYNQTEAQSVTSNAISSHKYSSMVVPVYLSSQSSPDQEILTYAMLDTQSDTTFLLSHVAYQLSAKYQDTQLKLSTMTSKDELIKTKLFKDLQVRGYSCGKKVRLPSAYTREYIPATESHIMTADSVKEIDHLKHLAPFLAPKLNCEVGILIGYDCSHALLPRRVEAGSDSQPFAVETDLGWSVVGCYDQSTINAVTCNYAKASGDTPSRSCLRVKSSVKEVVAPQDVLNILNQDFKDLDESTTIGDTDQLSQNDIKFMGIVKSGVHQNEDGFYTMPIPTLDCFQLPNNKWIAEKRFQLLQRRLSRDNEYAVKYHEFMNSVIQRGEAEPVPSDSTNPIWYLPHHGVVHPRKPGKVRVVFDCSARCNGMSLNDILLQGPDMNNSLLGVLLRFRLGEIAVTCDIERMFFQFRVPSEHRDMLRFLWYGGDGQTKEYRMKVHLFGATSSPSCAIFGLQQLVKDHGDDFPLARDFIQHHFYVDDGLISTDSVHKATHIALQSIEMCKRANIRLCKFMSNNKSVMDNIPETERAPEVKTQELVPQLSSALGVSWLIESDEFCFRLEMKDTPLTRRGILSTVSSVYNPLGLVAPVILQGKQILKDVCESGKQWDDELPDDVRERWQKWRYEITQLSELKIRRCLKPGSFGQVVTQELHHFSDASQVGYGSCSYLRQINTAGDVACSLLMAKSRVAPSKITTIPRLELQASTLTTRLSKLMRQELNIGTLKEFYYTDSEIVMGYISNEAKRFHTFVANRVQQIRNSTDVSQWSHVVSAENPADHASRGMTVTELQMSNWFEGPAFLHSKEHDSSAKHTEYSVKDNDPEVKSAVCNTLISNSPDSMSVGEWLKRFSDLHKAIRTVEVLQRWPRLMKARQSGIKLQITRDYAKALKFVITEFQKEAFSDELDLLASNKHLPKKHPLAKLDPFMDQDNLMRVRGRLSNSEQTTHNERHPVIIPRNSHLATLIVRDCHDSHHQGRGITTAKVREKGYWIIGCTAVIKSYIHHCVPCRRLRFDTQEQKMADLPAVRLETLGPFVSTGMDCFGPFHVKDGRRLCKKYGIVFTCLSTRAVHLEMLDDLTSDAFINALRCLISIRGQVCTLLSDQGTNFKGASAELQKALADMGVSDLKTYLSRNMIDFRFNPPSASHAGGVWERQIRTIRSVLNAQLNSLTHPPDSTTLRTFLYEAMALINGRPLTDHTLNDPQSPKPLTPNDILLMKSSVVSQPPGEFDNSYLRRRWHFVQHMTNQFWKRWKLEYIQQLQERQKWLTPKDNLQAGDIVLIKDDSSARGDWPIGRIDTVYPGSDGLVRKVRIALSCRLDAKGRRQGRVQYL